MSVLNKFVFLMFVIDIVTLMVTQVAEGCAHTGQFVSFDVCLLNGNIIL